MLNLFIEIIKLAPKLKGIWQSMLKISQSITATKKP